MSPGGEKICPHFAPAMHLSSSFSWFRYDCSEKDMDMPRGDVAVLDGTEGNDAGVCTPGSMSSISSPPLSFASFASSPFPSSSVACGSCGNGDRNEDFAHRQGQEVVLVLLSCSRCRIVLSKSPYIVSNLVGFFSHFFSRTTQRVAVTTTDLKSPYPWHKNSLPFRFTPEMTNDAMHSTLCPPKMNGHSGVA